VVTNSKVFKYVFDRKEMVEDFNKYGKEIVPDGTFFAKDFYPKKDRNHGDGYHDHLVRKKDDKRCAIRITFDGENVYVEEHGQGIRVNLDKTVSYIEANCLEDILSHLSGFKNSDLAKPTSKARKIKIPQEQKLY
jgi:hypothetical protein